MVKRLEGVALLQKDHNFNFFIKKKTKKVQELLVVRKINEIIIIDQNS